MSSPQAPKPAKLVVGMFLKLDAERFAHIVKYLTDCFGKIDIVSRWFAFSKTDYYAREMGNGLFRRLIVFKSLVQPHLLPEIKLCTNNIEKKFFNEEKRSVNIDPGLLGHERFILATGKNYTHRVYLNKGIYADLTLIYQKGGFCTLPWTYPDYEEKPMIVFLNQVRQKYCLDIKTENIHILDDIPESIKDVELC